MLPVPLNHNNQYRLWSEIFVGEHMVFSLVGYQKQVIGLLTIKMVQDKKSNLSIDASHKNVLSCFIIPSYLQQEWWNKAPGCTLGLWEVYVKFNFCPALALSLQKQSLISYFTVKMCLSCGAVSEAWNKGCDECHSWSIGFAHAYFLLYLFIDGCFFVFGSYRAKERLRLTKILWTLKTDGSLGFFYIEVWVILERVPLSKCTPLPLGMPQSSVMPNSCHHNVFLRSDISGTCWTLVLSSLVVTECFCLQFDELCGCAPDRSPNATYHEVEVDGYADTIVIIFVPPC